MELLIPLNDAMKSQTPIIILSPSISWHGLEESVIFENTKNKRPSPLKRESWAAAVP